MDKQPSMNESDRIPVSVDYLLQLLRNIEGALGVADPLELKNRLHEFNANIAKINPIVCGMSDAYGKEYGRKPPVGPC